MSWKCLVACLFFDESQQPTWPHTRHDARGTGLFVAEQALFRWAVSGLPPWSCVVALAALIALAPVGFAMPALALSGAAALIVGLAVWESLGYRARVCSPRRSTP